MKPIVKIVALTTVLLATSSSRAIGKIYDSLAYTNGNFPISNKSKNAYPYNSFTVVPDKAGVGHIQSGCMTCREFPRDLKLERIDTILSDWAERIKFLSPEKGWVPLTSEAAREIWGRPFIHGKFDTFDVESIWNGETNLYHIDLLYEKSHVVKAYRVRGIGIISPTWVNSNYMLPKTYAAAK